MYILWIKTRIRV